ncbi:uncharacterized protein [Montipora foliosa]|uniref:uncharacterized protein n=1 Tax=Montipora foliosa TaxID=591990 RepID=UPI0035F2162D
MVAEIMNYWSDKLSSILNYFTLVDRQFSAKVRIPDRDVNFLAAVRFQRGLLRLLLTPNDHHKLRVAAIKWGKRGNTTLAVPGHDPPVEITIFMDVEINPGPDSSQNDYGERTQLFVQGSSFSPLVLCSVNVRSVKSKSAANLLDYIYTSRADPFAFTETWLTANDTAAKLEFIPPQTHKFLHHNRSGRKGGGTGLLFRENIDVSKIDADEKTSFEFSEWSLNTNSFRAMLSIIYRPPYSNLHPVSLKTFFDEFASYMESIILTPEPLIITGDFNIHVNNVNDSDACEFLDLLASLGLKQHVIGPTHEGGHTLDLVITRQYDQSLLCDTNTASFPRVDNVRLANDFGNSFAQKIENINASLANSSTSSVPSLPAADITCLKERFTGFKTLSQEQVRLLISKAAGKSCQLDPIPTPIVLKLLDVLLPVITKLINLSFDIGRFAEAWKEALVLPSLKKPGLNSGFKNLRPVSNHSYISKLSERAGVEQFMEHLTANDLHSQLQSAYKQQHSTETALLKVKNDILMSMDEQHVTLLVLLDLSAAFDTIHHDKLIDRLESDLGITDNVLAWLKSYLSDRFHRVSVNGSLSHQFPLKQGVPQGSCLVPLLFTIYTRKLFQIVESHLPQVHCYADDTQLYVYVSFSPNRSADADFAINSMTDCICDIRSWMISDNLMLNDDKTEFLIIGTRQQLAKVNISCIRVGSTDVCPVTVARNLGSWFDEQLTMSTHISKLCGVAFYHLHNIKRIRKYLSRESTEMLVHAFITSRVDYCDSLLYGLPNYQLNKLQRVLNASARLRTFTPPNSSSSGFYGDVQPTPSAAQTTPGAAQDPSWNLGQWSGESSCSESDDFKTTVGIFNEALDKLSHGKFQPLTSPLTKKWEDATAIE